MWKTFVVFSQVAIHGVSPIDLQFDRLIHYTLLPDANTLSGVDIHDMHVQMQVPGAVPTAVERRHFQNP